MADYKSAVSYWQRKNIKTEAQLAEALNGYIISFAYNSGKIENENITYFDTREVFEHDSLSSYTGDLRTIFELRNAKDASELMLEAFGKKRVLDEGLVKEFHLQLVKNTYDKRRWELGERPGEYKKHDYITGKDEIGAGPEDVSEEMAELLAEMADVTDENVLISAAYFHAKFENIHPFADGNGRTGRLLMNYMLLLYDHPPITIHEEDRREYYEALSAWDSRQELDPLISYLKEQTVKTWEKQVKRKWEKNGR